MLLQLDGPVTVSAAAERLGVARSTAHRLLGMLVYRDFAVQGENRQYRAGPVLELATRAGSDLSGLRAAALGPVRRLVAALEATAKAISRALA